MACHRSQGHATGIVDSTRRHRHTDGRVRQPSGVGGTRSGRKVEDYGNRELVTIVSYTFLHICLVPTVGSFLRRGFHFRQTKACRKNSRLALPSFSKEP